MPAIGPFKIYGDTNSGNCQKVRLVADYLRLPYDWVPVDLTKAETRSLDFLARFPQGQVPAIEFGDGRSLAQSNGIVRFLARGSRLLPEDSWTQAKIDEWLFWEQYSHEPYIAVCRSHIFYQGKSKETRESWRVVRGEKALDHMEHQLTKQIWLVEGEFTIADIVLFAYTRVAHEGGFDLTPRPHVQNWIARCEKELIRANLS